MLSLNAEKHRSLQQFSIRPENENRMLRLSPTARWSLASLNYNLSAAPSPRTLPTGGRPKPPNARGKDPCVTTVVMRRRDAQVFRRTGANIPNLVSLRFLHRTLHCHIDRDVYMRHGRCDSRIKHHAVNRCHWTHQPNPSPTVSL